MVNKPEIQYFQLSSELTDEAAVSTEQSIVSMSDANAAVICLEGVDIQSEPLEGRRRRISAAINISHPVEQIWQILTDYDHLADFIPNLAESRRIEHPEGGIRLEQVGTESLMRLKVCLRVVLDMVERFPHAIEFNMVEGDFRQFVGAWELEPLEQAAVTRLRYVVTVLPGRAMPIALIERNLRRNLVRNLIAIQQHADQKFGIAAS
ncbi:SRPBCC family protein [Vacuolonema iberomarrocanum]|uniref:SRPBCC family protein n=1 Tax=Vacuolonema iberomarrocanum TaxID=3454632 RepID=UPI003F6E3A8D